METQLFTPPGWLRIAVHALVVLAETDGACTSATVAKELKAHATFLRRVMVPLVHAQILVVREGRDGGYRLARPAESITLAEVYQALKGVCQPEKISEQEAEHSHFQLAFNALANEIEDTFLAVLARHTIASMSKQAKSASLQ
ncbi:transcriptional regulator [Ktedonosporobacter rubrisoli]|uniref:Transcriptional regulator n=1 Tax=Ktedonosporobacter rubrisoli TaxID=2509675 RepID=A0A4P6JL23_KTERU|nr:Rrf2 family transcriptional regulator [Ktedonosporobacter rubrisoli]QBD75889.1 transcriptional regulator [Ktedonosporobacter rubrisoli]